MRGRGVTVRGEAPVNAARDTPEDDEPSPADASIPSSPQPACPAADDIASPASRAPAIALTPEQLAALTSAMLALAAGSSTRHTAVHTPAGSGFWVLFCFSICCAIYIFKIHLDLHAGQLELQGKEQSLQAAQAYLHEARAGLAQTKEMLEAARWQWADARAGMQRQLLMLEDRRHSNCGCSIM